uniref:Interleukin-18 n=1 Tax=Oryzias latipes TaxID=8090 RepID=A0A3P9L4P6_ORYLA
MDTGLAEMEAVTLTFFGTCEDLFLFEVLPSPVCQGAPTRCEGDGFRISKCTQSNCWIQSKEQKFLILHNTGTLDVQDLNAEQRQQSECRFNIQYYQNTSRDATKKRPVILYAFKNGQTVAVCCHDEHTICSQPMDLPENICETKHKALFYRTKVSTNLYMFESSVYTSRFLAFEPLDNNPCIHKLVLRNKSEDEVDEPCQVIVSQM